MAGARQKILRTVVHSVSGRLLRGDETEINEEAPAGSDEAEIGIPADEVVLRQIGYKPNKEAWDVLKFFMKPEPADVKDNDGNIIRGAGSRRMSGCGLILTTPPDANDYITKFAGSLLEADRHYVMFKDVDGDMQYYWVSMEKGKTAMTLTQIDMQEIRNRVSVAVSWDNMTKFGKLKLSEYEYGLAKESIQEYKSVINDTYKSIDRITKQVLDMIKKTTNLNMMPALLFELFEVYDRVTMNCCNLLANSASMLYYDEAKRKAAFNSMIAVMNALKQKRKEFEVVGVSYSEAYVILSGKCYDMDAAGQYQTDYFGQEVGDWFLKSFDNSVTASALSDIIGLMEGVVNESDMVEGVTDTGVVIATQGSAVAENSGYANATAMNALNGLSARLSANPIFKASLNETALAMDGKGVGEFKLEQFFAARYKANLASGSLDDIHDKLRNINWVAPKFRS